MELTRLLVNAFLTTYVNVEGKGQLLPWKHVLGVVSHIFPGNIGIPMIVPRVYVGLKFFC